MLIVYFFSIWAVITDIRSRRISNRLVILFLLAGMAVNAAKGLWSGMLVAFLVAAGISLLLYRINESMFGAGDYKFYIALAVLTGLKWSFGAFFYSLLVALPVFAFYMLKDGTKNPSIPYAVPFLGGIIWQQMSPLIG